MKDLFLKLKYDCNTNEFEIDSNIKLESQKDFVSNFIQGQMGAGKDDRKADERDVYEIDFGVYLSCGKYTVSDNCGNKGLREGILMQFLKRA